MLGWGMLWGGGRGERSATLDTFIEFLGKSHVLRIDIVRRRAIQSEVGCPLLKSSLAVRTGNLNLESLALFGANVAVRGLH